MDRDELIVPGSPPPQEEEAGGVSVRGDLIFSLLPPQEDAGGGSHGHHRPRPVALPLDEPPGDSPSAASSEWRRSTSTPVPVSQSRSLSNARRRSSVFSLMNERYGTSEFILAMSLFPGWGVGDEVDWAKLVAVAPRRGGVELPVEPKRLPMREIEEGLIKAHWTLVRKAHDMADVFFEATARAEQARSPTLPDPAGVLGGTLFKIPLSIGCLPLSLGPHLYSTPHSQPHSLFPFPPSPTISPTPGREERLPA